MEQITEPLLLTRKDVLTVLPGRSERFVSDMKRAGFRLPTTRTQIFNFLRRCPFPSRFRENGTRRFPGKKSGKQMARRTRRN